MSEPLPEIRLNGDPVPYVSREERIAAIAYRRAEERGFGSGQELEDWLAAEREVDGTFGTASNR